MLSYRQLVLSMVVFIDKPIGMSTTIIEVQDTRFEWYLELAKYGTGSLEEKCSLIPY